MKGIATILPAMALALASCGGGGPVTNSGYDPLDPAGGFGADVPVVDTGYRPGAFVVTAMDNAAFFKSKPQGNATADKLLPGNTRMKVISNDGNYLKVELDTGEVGYTLPVMVTDEAGGGAATTVDPYNPNEVQVYPPLPGGGYDPNAPTIPPVIDPDAPDPEEELPMPALPDDAPTPGLGAEPPLPDPAAEDLPADPAGEDPPVEVE